MKKWMRGVWEWLTEIAPDTVVRHERAGKITEEELRGWLEGQAEQATVRGAMEIAERLIWTYWQEGRGGMPAEEMVHKVDAIMEFQAQLMAFSEVRKKPVNSGK